jgi:acetyl-CoA C-acetyltransferase
MKQAVILSSVRTPVGKLGGALSQVTDRTLAGLVIKEAMARAGITPEQVEELVFSQQYGCGRGDSDRCS